ncbi:hypothetical protein [Arachidicoccus sp.]|jgi:hypothetical protein|uniref:hypothetical protein n=1 Tax=Arachidicoccus sp. TaxID=1872624 RepID=UPI003D1E94B8
MAINEEFRKQQRKRYRSMRAVKDIVMALIILGIGFLMFFGKHFHLLQGLMESKDPLILNIFGSLCVLYGGFRLYRGIKHEY